MTISPCQKCKHFDLSIKEQKTCLAFPKGIPDKYLGYWDEFKLPMEHNKPEKDQVGDYIFTQRTEFQ